MPLTPSDLPDEVRASLGEIRQLVLPPQGMTSEVAVVESWTGRYVVKRARHPLYMHWLREEYRVLKVLEPLSLPIPRAYQLVERTSSNGDECWLLMSYLPGTPLAHTLGVERDPDLRVHIARQWGAILRNSCRRHNDLIRWIAVEWWRSGCTLQRQIICGSGELRRRKAAPRSRRWARRCCWRG